MSDYLFSAVIVVVLLIPAQGSSQTASGKDEKKTTTLNGCIGRATAPTGYTFSENTNGDKYRLTGRGLGKYTGKRVEIIGAFPVPKRFTIRGGLWPSPNVAAQAGALDPAQAAIATLPGGTSDGTGTLALPEFHVVRVRPIDGECR